MFMFLKILFNLSLQTKSIHNNLVEKKNFDWVFLETTNLANMFLEFL
jgi:hypothetical protein